MRKQLMPTILTVLFSSILITAQTETNTSSSGGIDWFELIILTGYLLGVFILLPIVIYTNMKEKLFVATPENQSEIQPIENLSEEEKNDRSSLILNKIENNLTSFQNEDGESMLTITSGKQAKFTKQGLDYINQKLIPTNPEIIERVKEFSEVYSDRTKRAFTGSNWIIGFSAAVGILFLWTGGITTFIFIHFLGLLFYILSSRTTYYTIEKRMNSFGGGSGIMSSIMKGLLLGNGVKYYVRDSSGFRRRDWETEGQMAIIGLMLMAFIAIILGILTAFLGVINSIINYSTSYMLPFKPKEDWYEKNIAINS